MKEVSASCEFLDGEDVLVGILIFDAQANLLDESTPGLLGLHALGVSREVFGPPGRRGGHNGSDFLGAGLHVLCAFPMRREIDFNFFAVWVFFPVASKKGLLTSSGIFGRWMNQTTKKG